MNNIRKIATGLTGEIAHDILVSVNGQLSDGIWENSPRMNGYWIFSSISIDDNKNVYIDICTDSYTTYGYNTNHTKKFIYNKFLHMNDSDIKKWYANKILQIIKAEFPHKATRNRNSITEMQYMGYTMPITIKDAYNVSDTLRKN